MELGNRPAEKTTEPSMTHPSWWSRFDARVPMTWPDAKVERLIDELDLRAMSDFEMHRHMEELDRVKRALTWQSAAFSREWYRRWTKRYEVDPEGAKQMNRDLEQQIKDAERGQTD